jgi:hypothetical protein
MLLIFLNIRSLNPLGFDCCSANDEGSIYSRPLSSSLRAIGLTVSRELGRAMSPFLSIFELMESIRVSYLTLPLCLIHHYGC